MADRHPGLQPGLCERMIKKNTHGLKLNDCLRTNSGGQYARVGNTPEHSDYGKSMWPRNIWMEEFYE